MLSFTQIRTVGACFALCAFILVGHAVAAPPATSTVNALPQSASSLGLTDLILDPIATGLSDIVTIAHAGDDRLFLCDKAGLIRIWDGTQILAEPFLDISGLVSFSLERGLLSLAFHPDYATNGLFYVYYTDTDTDPILARYEVMAGDPNRADPSSGVILLDIPHFGGHYGGSLNFGPDGYLYFGLGDGGQQQDPSCRAQNTGLLQGKILRIDVDQNIDTPPFHGIPADNPFVDDPLVPDEVWAIGFRNPWRLTFDRLTGDLLISDVGQFEREEVSFQPADSPGGENYGWKVMEGTFCFDPDPIDTDCPASTASCFDPSYTAPVIEYDHDNGDCSITGGYVYRGSRVAELSGSYLYGDWCTGNLWAAGRSGDTWTPELLDISLSMITTWGEDNDGELYLTDGNVVYQLTSTGALFIDGFETGDTTAWSSALP